jgi:hypothetical protein
MLSMGFAKQSFAPKWVPKLELGNQKTKAADNLFQFWY